jgi:hypothetical protein
MTSASLPLRTVVAVVVGISRAVGPSRFCSASLPSTQPRFVITSVSFSAGHAPTTASES